MGYKWWREFFEGLYRRGLIELLQKFVNSFARFVHHLQNNDYTVSGEDLRESIVVC